MNWDKIEYYPNIPTEVIHALHTAHKFFAQNGDAEWEVGGVASRNLVHSLRQEVKELRAVLPPPSDRNRTEAEIPPRYSSIYVKVDAIAGTDIADACRDLCALADRLGIGVHTNFNGIIMSVPPGTNHEKLTIKWRRALSLGHKFA